MLGQMLDDADRTHAGSAPAVRDAKGLVQVQMTDIGAVVTRPAQADLGVHVGAVEVDLAAVVVNDLADLANTGLEDSVGRWIGHHQRPETFAMLLGSCSQVVEVDIAVVVTLHRHDLEARHHGAGRVGSMRGGRDEADSAIQLAARLVVAADHEEPGVLALRPGVGLE